MNRVLVTGGCGLIGFNIAKHYRELGLHVDVMDTLERSELLGHEVSSERRYFNWDALKAMGVNVILADVSHPEAWNAKGISCYYQLGTPDVIFHMAGQCGVPTSIQNPRRDFEVNAIGTFNMLEFARERGSRVVYASTNKVYPIHGGWQKNEAEYRWEWKDDKARAHGVDTWNTPHPCWDSTSRARTPYGTSKYTGDLLCQEYYHSFGVPTGVFRMSCIYGPNQFGFEEQGWATWFAIATLKGLPIRVYGDGMQVRDMLYVEDLVKAYDKFARSDIEHGVWNIGGGPEFTLSLNECIDMLGDMTDKRSRIIYDEWRPADQKVYTSDIRPLFSAFGWKPEIGPKEGLERVIKWVSPIIDIF